MAETLSAQLLALAHHVRDPVLHGPPPGLEARRLAVYRQLFLGNLTSLLAGGFPVIHASLGEGAWQDLVSRFYGEYRCRTPLFTQLAGEFVAWLGDLEDAALPSWLAELAHYEWVESELLLSDATECAHDPRGDLLDGVPLLSRLAWPLAYAWPVCDLGPGHLPKRAPNEPTLLLARRGTDLKVHFSRLAPLAHALLVSLQDSRRSGREHIGELADAVGVEREVLMPQGLALLESLREQGVVLGTRSG